MNPTAFQQACPCSPVRAARFPTGWQDRPVQVQTKSQQVSPTSPGHHPQPGMGWKITRACPRSTPPSSCMGCHLPGPWEPRGYHDLLCLRSSHGVVLQVGAGRDPLCLLASRPERPRGHLHRTGTPNCHFHQEPNWLPTSATDQPGLPQFLLCVGRWREDIGAGSPTTGRANMGLRDRIRGEALPDAGEVAVDR